MEAIIRTNTNRPYQICTCCVMDTTDEYITFDSNGLCMRCNEFKTRVEPMWNHGKGHEEELKNLISQIKERGKGKEYDCILGLSGGLDSSYLLHLAVKEWGLRPCVYHIDAGWNLPIAEENVRRITDKLGVELHIEKLDWEEMKEMQLAWFRTGLESLDVPQDHAFIAVIDKVAGKLGIKYILNGGNLTTETFADPASWAKGGGPTGDGTFVKDVIRKYCKKPIKKYTFTNGFKHKFVVPYIHGVKTVLLLNYIEFTKQEMIDTLVKEYDYVPYGQKHFEDLITKFLEGYWVPKRFGHDIRRTWLSALVVTGQMSREDALKELEHPPLTEEEGRTLFADVAKKLEISEEELEIYLNLPECTESFKSQEKLYSFGIRLYEKLGLEARIRK
ncbi:N-acetyl sugar amidotransferase [Lachnospiraceae bacterium XBD2001]|nr:N-acetyl sugar amidotransferase [Lachnospiraceae bacterium XBD2001]